MDVAASVEAKDLKGFTPLLAAAADGRGDAVAVLLANKADASAQGQEEYHELTPAGGTDPAGPIRLRVEPSAESDAADRARLWQWRGRKWGSQREPRETAPGLYTGGTGELAASSGVLAELAQLHGVEGKSVRKRIKSTVTLGQAACRGGASVARALLDSDVRMTQAAWTKML